MALRISVFASPSLQAVILALRDLDRETKTQIRRFTRQDGLPIWQEETRGHAQTRMEVRVLADTARVKPSDQNVQLTSATVGRGLSKSPGSKPSDLAHSVEFGANEDFVKSYEARSRKGTPYTVHNRHTRRQFRPRNLKGYTVYPAAKQAIPRFASLWVQTVVRTLHEAIEKE